MLLRNKELLDVWGKTRPCESLELAGLEIGGRTERNPPDRM